MSVHKEVKRITTHTVQEMKNRGEKVTCLPPTIIQWPQ